MNNIDTSKWQWFRIGDIFKVEKSQNIKKDDAEEIMGGNVPYITRTEFNNGCNFFVEQKNIKTQIGNCITIGGEGANVFYQPINFITGNNITKIYNKNLNENNGLFIVSILNLEKYRYSYNRAFNQKNIINTYIKLPSKNNEPDWEYMEQYIKSLREREREFSTCWILFTIRKEISTWYC